MKQYINTDLIRNNTVKLLLIFLCLQIMACATAPSGPNLTTPYEGSLFREAMGLSAAGKHDEAIERLMRIYENKTDSDLIMGGMANQYWNKNDYLQAAFWYEKAYQTQKENGVFTSSFGLARTAMRTAESHFSADNKEKAKEYAELAVLHAKQSGDDTKQEAYTKKSKFEITNEAKKLLGKISASLKELEPLDYSPKSPSQVFINSIDMEFILIPAGSYMTGSDKKGDTGTPRQQVEIGQSFFIGKHEVTQEEWFRIMGNYPSAFKGRKRPVESVSWNDVREFIQKLNEKEDTDVYRLPSEREWEYSVRAGTGTRYFFGEKPDKIQQFAWMCENTASTQPVGTRHPNPWGLYDMIGNVAEWCSDEYKKNKVAIRGCDWRDLAQDCHSAAAFSDRKGDTFSNVGFRLVRDLKSPIAALRKKAEQGDSNAQVNLGYKYEEGNWIKQDHEKALKWYTKAAEAGDKIAQNNLGVMYYMGTGVKQDYDKALELFKRSAEQGYKHAQFNMGLMYEYGNGVGQNVPEAIQWYSRSAEQGDDLAITALTRLGIVFKKSNALVP